MKDDEAHHATVAIESGAVELPSPIKGLMRLMAKVMTTVVYRI
jgi:ubiquinone biosynthesis monooxygenase Coq7